MVCCVKHLQQGSVTALRSRRKQGSLLKGRSQREITPE